MNQNSRFFIILLTLATGLQLQAVVAQPVMTQAEKLAAQNARRAAAKAHMQALQQQHTQALAKQQANNARMAQQTAAAKARTQAATQNATYQAANNVKAQALLHAVQQNNIVKVQQILSTNPGPDVLNAQDRNPIYNYTCYACSPLFWAIYKKNLKIVQLLIKAGANLNMKVDNGLSSSISTAVIYGTPAIMHALINAGAIVTHDDLNMAVAQSNPVMLNIIINKGIIPTINDLHIAQTIQEEFPNNLPAQQVVTILQSKLS